jgi:hypothetical protein
MIYQFETQKKVGKAGEELIKESFSPDWIITPSSYADQKRGIDFYFNHRKKDLVCTVEVKTDTKAHETGNAFFETYSDYPKKKGWAYTCQADYFFYFVLYDRLIYVFAPSSFSRLIPKWTKYPSRSINNQRWTTIGHLVPLHEFERYSDKTLSI